MIRDLAPTDIIKLVQFLSLSQEEFQSRLPFIPREEIKEYEVTNIVYDSTLSDLWAILKDSRQDYEFLKTALQKIPNQLVRHRILSTYVLVHNELAFKYDGKVSGKLNENLLIITSHIQTSLLNQNLSSQNSAATVVVTIELLLNLVAGVFERILFYERKSDINFNFTPKQIEQDSKLLFNFKTNMYLIHPIIKAIDFLYTIVRKKEFLQSQIKVGKSLSSILGKRKIIDHLDVFLKVISLVKKYEIDDVERIEFLYEPKIIDFPEIFINMQSFIECFLENLLIDYSSCKNDFKKVLGEYLNGTDKINNVLVFASCVYSNTTHIKFSHNDYNVDFHSYFMDFYEFANFLSDKINSFFIQELNTYIYLIKSKKNEKRISIDINILDKYLYSVKDFIVYSMVASFNNDSLCDCYVKNEWMRYVLDSYVIGDAVQRFISVILEYSSKINEVVPLDNDDIVSRLFAMFLEDFDKCETIMPLKLFFFKQSIVHDSLILFDFFAGNFVEEIKSCIEKDKIKTISFTKVNSILSNLVKEENMLTFSLSSRILKYLNYGDQLKGHLGSLIRVYNEAREPLDYFDIPMFHKYTQKKIKKAPLLINNEDKENINYLSNISTNSTTIQNTFTNPNSSNMTKTTKKNNNSQGNQTDLKQGVMTVPSVVEQYDITSLINQGNESQFKSIDRVNITYSTTNAKKHIISIKEETPYDFPLILFQRDYDIEMISFDPKNNITNYMETKYSSKRSMESVCENLLYNEPTGKKKENLDNTMLYYDREFEMDLFEFEEQLKILIK